ERAAKVRDQIAAITRVMEKQNVQEMRYGDLDIFGFHRSDDFCSIQVMLNRDGKLIHSSTHSFRTPLADEQVFSSFLTQFYAQERYLPPEVLLPFEFEDQALIEEWLSQRRKARVRVFAPQRGGKKKLVEMATQNAEVNSSTDERREQAQSDVATVLGRLLGVDRPVRTIECYDVAHLQGSLSVASRVVFEDGESVPALYRRYKLKTVEGNDDFASMIEVLSRRFRPSTRRDAPPDVVMVDGGKGQVSSAKRVLDRIGVPVTLIGLAKDRVRGGKHTTERVYLPEQSEPLDLPETSAASRYLQRIRDEAHRFANEFHRELRRKKALTTGLEEIPGVGIRRRKALLTHFGSLKAVRNATVEELAAVPGMTEATAIATHDFLRNEEESSHDA
ncbi:MAG: excinuclease ABC subunit UvrC, partial [Planctomycetota bacterium]